MNMEDTLGLLFRVNAMSTVFQMYKGDISPM